MSTPIRGSSVATAARLELLPLTSYQRGIFLVIATAWFFASMDLVAPTFVLGSIRTEFDLSPDAAGLLSSISFIGMFAGASAAGLLADRFGRRIVFQSCMISGGSAVLAPDAQFLGLPRILPGFGMGTEFSGARSMVSELIPAKNRGRYIAYLKGFWPLGFIFSGLFCLAVVSATNWWRVFIMAGTPAIFVLIVRRYVAESPRWLASHCDTAEAERVMTRIETAERARIAEPVAGVR